MQDSLVEYGARRVIITITAILCALLEIVDSTIVNVALNEMKGNLGSTLSEVGWVITAYAIGNVIIVPMTSWLSQQFGRRNYFAASIIIFTSGSKFSISASGSFHTRAAFLNIVEAISSLLFKAVVLYWSMMLFMLFN